MDAADMTTRTRPSLIEILADAAVRRAVEAGSAVVVFDPALETVFFADAAAGEIVGDAGAAPSPALRQIRSAARHLALMGRARVLLRQSTRSGTRLLTVDLLLRPSFGEDESFALIEIGGIGPAFRPADLLDLAGLGRTAAAVYSGNERVAATPAFASHGIADLGDRAAKFAWGSQPVAEIDDGRVVLFLSRAPFNHVVVRVAASAASAESAPAAPAPDEIPATVDADAAGSPAAIEDREGAATGFSSFSVRRPKIGETRTGMSMSALLQRWHSRGPEDASTADEAQPLGAPAPGDRPEIDAANPAVRPTSDVEETEPGAAQAETSAAEEVPPPAPMHRIRQRSNWGSKTAAPESVVAAASAVGTSAIEPEAASTSVEPVAEDDRQFPADAAGSEPSAAPNEASETESAAPPASTDEDDAASRSAAIAAAEAPVPPVDAAPSADETAEHRDISSADDRATAAAVDVDRRDVPPAAGLASATVPPGDDDGDGDGDGETVFEPARPAGFAPRFDVPPVRFVWQIDRDGAFRFLSPDFASAVGPNAADVVGRSFADVARVFGFDGTREIARLLERRDTWSGRTIFWPVEGSDRKVPVDLAALPVYGRDRSFDGFRGFGIVRLNESVEDEEGLGLHLTSAAPPAGTPAARTDERAPAAAPPREKPFLRRFEAESFGRRAEPPVVSDDATDPDGSLAPTEGQPDGPQKVIRLEERRRPRDGALSVAEEAAFRAIGVKLGHQAEAESPGALRFEEPEAPKTAAEDPAGAEARGADTAEPEPADMSGDGSVDPAVSPADMPAPRADRQNEGADAGSAVAAPAARLGEDSAEPAIGDDAATQIEPSRDLAPTVALPAGTGSSTDEPFLADALSPVASAADASSRRSDPVSIWADEDPEDPDAEIPLDIAVFERLFAGLPLAILVQVRERPVYANTEFATLTGHDDAASVEAAGGLDELVLDRQGEGTLALRRADGEIVEVRAHMQRIAEGGRSALLMSFSPVAGELVDAGPALDDLRQEVEELQAVLDTATDGVVLLDMGGNIRAMNGSAHALFGLSADEAFGRHLSSLFAHESQKSTVDYLEMLRDDGIGGILNDGREVIGRVSQGGFIPLFITIGRLSGERGWCVVIRDIAHWKRIEEDLVNARRQAEAASLHKSRFLANISHELRTPLNAIIGFADVMSSECFGPIGNERYLEYLGDIKRSGHHVLDLVNDLLDISKIEAGKIDLSFEAVSLNEVVSEVVSLMQPQANRERVIVRSNLPSSVPPVVADRRTMRQIALNLVANAIRFTPAGGQIIASTTYTAEGDVLLRFRDSGIGMTEREIELALTPFQQVHAPSANRGEGTGLGLPLTKAMVEANRAQFAIHSTPGEGTLVEIAFPAPRVLAD